MQIGEVFHVEHSQNSKMLIPRWLENTAEVQPRHG